MKFKSRLYSLVYFSVLIALSGTVNAATTYMDASNDAMGGTGVASSHYGTAALANPALLTHFGVSDDFSLILPSVGAQVSDPDHLQNAVDDVKDAWDRYDSELSPGAAADLKQQLLKFKNTHASAQASVGIVTDRAVATDTCERKC
ncbi:conjugal transfer protein TraF [Salmonella enterica]|nr:conjugal transfer protein TraF [Salmonella enterica subsp. enterica]EHI7575501.1 conjugal transfer protein TraF [Salmonella enterica]